jgi:hypothetical protein
VQSNISTLRENSLPADAVTCGKAFCDKNRLSEAGALQLLRFRFITRIRFYSEGLAGKRPHPLPIQEIAHGS